MSATPAAPALISSIRTAGHVTDMAMCEKKGVAFCVTEHGHVQAWSLQKQQLLSTWSPRFDSRLSSARTTPCAACAHRARLNSTKPQMSKRAAVGCGRHVAQPATSDDEEGDSFYKQACTCEETADASTHREKAKSSKNSGSDMKLEETENEQSDGEDVNFLRCASSPDSDKLLAVASDGDLFMWQLQDSILVRCSVSLPRATGTATCLAVTPCMTWAVAGQRGGAVQFWDLSTKTATTVRSSPHKGAVVGAALNQTGTLAATVCASGTLVLWRRTSASSGPTVSSSASTPLAAGVSWLQATLGPNSTFSSFAVINLLQEGATTVASMPGSSMTEAERPWPRGDDRCLCLSMSLCGKSVAVGTRGGLALVVSTGEARLILAQRVGSNPVRGIGMNGDGSLLLTCLDTSHPGAGAGARGFGRVAKGMRGGSAAGALALWCLRSPSPQALSAECLTRRELAHAPRFCCLQRPGLLASCLDIRGDLHTYMLPAARPWGARFFVPDINRPMTSSFDSGYGMTATTEGLHVFQPLCYRHTTVLYEQMRGIQSMDCYTAQVASQPPVCAFSVEHRCAVVAIGAALYVAKGPEVLTDLANCAWQRIALPECVHMLAFTGADGVLVILGVSGTVTHAHLLGASVSIQLTEALAGVPVTGIQATRAMYAAQVADSTVLMLPTGTMACQPVPGLLLGISDEYLCQLRPPQAPVQQPQLAVHNLKRGTGRAVRLRISPQLASVSGSTLALLSPKGAVAFLDCQSLRVMKQMEVGCLPFSLYLQQDGPSGPYTCFASRPEGVLALRTTLVRPRRQRTPRARTRQGSPAQAAIVAGPAAQQQVVDHENEDEGVEEDEHSGSNGNAAGSTTTRSAASMTAANAATTTGNTTNTNNTSSSSSSASSSPLSSGPSSFGSSSSSSSPSSPSSSSSSSSSSSASEGEDESGRKNTKRQRSARRRREKKAARLQAGPSVVQANPPVPAVVNTGRPPVGSRAPTILPAATPGRATLAAKGSHPSIPQGVVPQAPGNVQPTTGGSQGLPPPLAHQGQTALDSVNGVPPALPHGYQASKQHPRRDADNDGQLIHSVKNLNVV